MSLIDEALRRARQQAASQDAARRDEQYRRVPVLPPMASRRERSVKPVLIAAVLAVCIVAGIGIGVFLGRGAGEDRTSVAAVETTPAPPVVPDESAPSVETPRPAIVVEEIPEPAPVPTPTPAPAPERQPEEPPRQELPASLVSEAAEPVSPPPVLDATPAPEPATPAPEPPAEIRTYVREVPLPDGGTLRLNGIAFSSSKPVALIDDHVLGKGEGYQGFLVADIQAGMVELHGNGMIVRVSLK